MFVIQRFESKISTSITMKKIFPIFLLALISAVGCQKDFLDRAPLGQETDQNFYNDPTNAVLAVNSLYDAISWDEGPSANGYVPHNYEFMFTDVLSDDSEKGASPNDFFEITEMELWQSDAGSNRTTQGLWTNMFIGLFRTNTVLKNLPNATIPEDLKTRLIGEARFLRGYIYFYGARTFGPMPLFSEPVNPSDFRQVSRATLADTYKFIDDDFRAAAAALPEKNGYAPDDLGRATKGAANAYLSRSIMYQIGLGLNAHNWQEVYDLTGTVINSGQYSLLPNYAQIWEEEGENGAESIFEIQFRESTIGWGPEKTGSTSSIFQNNSDWWGWGFHAATQEFVASFEDKDPRKACTVFGEGDVVRGVKQTINPAQNATGFMNRKMATPKPLGESKASGVNHRKFRYADILLMRAESAAQTGKEEEARSLVNQIRDRARNSTKPKGSVENEPDGYVAYGTGELENALPPLTASVSGQALIDAIAHERRVELGLECLRYMDLIRTGKYLDSLPAAVRAACQSHTISEAAMPVLPIPRDEVDSWGIQQNPGY
jgi:starch-binding outer membrane protein, SusD/RagB family